MLTIDIKNIGITVYVFKDEETDTYEVVSSDNDGHEGRIASGLVTVDELHKVLEKYFGPKFWV